MYSYGYNLAVSTVFGLKCSHLLYVGFWGSNCQGSKSFKSSTAKTLFVGHSAEILEVLAQVC